MIAIIIGTRPNYMKAFPIVRELKNKNILTKLIHTGQHYDNNVNDLFFEELSIDKPDVQMILKDNKNEADQISQIMSNLINEFLIIKPKLVLVFGDVSSSLAAALVSNKMKIPLAHIESGLRSFDKSMPEEINRILIDNMSDYLFITEQSGYDNLLNEKINGKKYLVGNTMIDTLVYAKNKGLLNDCPFKNEINNNKFIVVTIHRQSNVDNLEKFKKIMKCLNKIAEKYLIIFPLHHRTKKNIINNDIKLSNNILQKDALGYKDFMSLINYCSLVITDSGGIQEETTFLGKSCITLRENTERPITIEKGTNILSDIDNIYETINNKFDINYNTSIDLWDGKSSVRIVNKIINEIL
jgi:UDP-N-acetylglucosamine 2-epimerase (non-hydrolysing)